MSQDPLEEQIPDFADDLDMSIDEEPPGLLSKLKGFFKKPQQEDAFGQSPVDPEDPFALEESMDAMFARRRRMMAIGMIVGLVVLIGGGVALFSIDWSSHEPEEETPPQAVEKQPESKPAEKAPMHADEDSGTRVIHQMPVASGPEDLNKALIRPPGDYNPDAARRAGSLKANPQPRPQTQQEQSTPSTAASPQSAVEPQTQVAATPPASEPEPAMRPSVSRVAVPVLPPPRTNFSKHDVPPRLTDLEKLEGVTFKMRKAPQKGMQFRTPGGKMLPAISPEGKKPWKAYALDYKADKGKPQISIILRGLGLSKPLTTAAVLRMPPQVTLAFSPYSIKLNSQLVGARKYGHETLITIGLETSRFPTEDPGPDGLFTGLSLEENSKRLETSLSNGSVYLGILTSGGDVYAKSTKHMAALLSRIKDMGLIYITPNTRTAPFNLVAAKPARGVADVVIPEATFKTQVQAYLRQTEDIARSRGSAILIADATPLSLNAIARWIGSMKNRGFQFAPISAVVKE